MEDTVYVLAAKFNPFYDVQVLNGYVERLPYSFRKRYEAYRNERDRHLYILGKLLLIQGASLLGYTGLKLEDIRFNRFGKPFLLNNLYFNISHSGDYVVCVLSRCYTIGVDVEEMKPIPYTDMLHVFLDNEQEQIMAAENPMETFYRFWTKKEAAIKADGRGFSVPLEQVELKEDHAIVCNRKWLLKEIYLHNGYMFHVALNRLVPQPLAVHFINLL